jgi:Holliday junction resolvase RusA-like endonuclease
MIAASNLRSSPYRLSIELIGLPKRFNQGQGAHWSTRHRESQKWHKRLLGKMVVTRARPPELPLKRAHLKLTRYSSRAPDYDGLVQSFKPVVDALKKCLIISDDSMAVIGKPDYCWEKTGQREGKIKIELIEIIDASKVEENRGFI